MATLYWVERDIGQPTSPRNPWPQYQREEAYKDIETANRAARFYRNEYHRKARVVTVKA